MKTTITITTLSFTFLLATFNLVVAQPTIQWEKNLGGTSNETATSVIQTLDGGYIVAGGTSSSDGDVTLNKGGNDCWVVKLDANGTIQWQKTYGGSGNDAISNILQTTDSGYIFAASSLSNDGDVTNSKGNVDYWIVKIDSVGTIQWEKSYGGSSVDITREIKQTNDGGYIVVGSSTSTNGDLTGNNGSTDYWIVKIDVIGNLQWQKNYGGSSGEGANSIVQTTNGDYIIVGGSISIDGDITGNIGSTDYWVIRLDNFGNLLWQKNYGGSGSDAAKGVALSSNGGFVIGGLSNSVDGDVTSNNGNDDYWVIKIDSIGSLLWEKSIGGTASDDFQKLITVSDGGYAMIGSSGSSDGDVVGNYGGWDYWAVKIDSGGNIQWNKNLGGSFSDFGSTISETADNGFIVAGSSFSNDFDVTNNIGLTDFWVVKLNAVVGIEDAIDEEFISIYPNPNNGIFTINTKFNYGKFEVYNLLGKRVIGKTITGSNTIIDIKHHAKGIYFIKLFIDNKVVTKKIILK